MLFLWKVLYEKCTSTFFCTYEEIKREKECLQIEEYIKNTLHFGIASMFDPYNVTDIIYWMVKESKICHPKDVFMTWFTRKHSTYSNDVMWVYKNVVATKCLPVNGFY